MGRTVKSKVNSKYADAKTEEKFEREYSDNKGVPKKMPRSPGRPRKATNSDLTALLPFLPPEAIAQILTQSPDWHTAIEVYKTEEVEEEEVTYPEHAKDFMRDTLGYTMWPKLEEICDSVEKNHNTVVASGFGTGKCCRNTSEILLSNGTYVSAESLIGTQFELIAFDHSDWSMAKSFAYAADNGIQPIYRITLRNGVSIERTENHPLLTWEGWKMVSELKSGDRVAVPLQVEIDSQFTMPNEEIKILAYLIGDGAVKYSSVSLTQLPGKVADEFIECAQVIGCGVTIRPNTRSRATCYHLVSNGVRNSKGYPLNPGLELVRKYGIAGKGSRDKRVPPDIFRLSTEQIAVFLNRLFATDGWVDKTSVGYSSVSRGLITDIQRLLLRFGVYCGVYRKFEKKFQVESWTIAVTGLENILRFLTTIGPIYGKESACEKLVIRCEQMRGSVRRNRIEHDLLPKEAWDFIPSVYVGERGKRKRIIKNRNGLHISRRLVKLYEEVSGNKLFNGWADSDIGWMDIVDIEYLGELPTVAITVPSTHAYVTDVIDHNSVSAAAIACWWMCTHDPAMVITIAPTWGQTNGIIWAYIRDVGRRNNLPGNIMETPRWKITDARWAAGLSPRKHSDTDMASLQGRHNPNLLVIMDEAAGLPNIIWDTVQGLAVSGDNRVLAIGNPIEQSGPFWSAQNSKNWNAIRISCLEHPNCVEGREVIPGAVTREYVDGRCDEWAIEVEPNSPESIQIPWNGKWFKPMPIFLAKVLGISPEQAEDQLISLAWVKMAQERELDERSMEVIAGFDPAPRGGDDNAICVRRGHKVLAVFRKKGYDTQELALWYAGIATVWNVTKGFVDEAGSGAGVYDKLKAMGVPVVPINFARSARQKKRFANMRAEAYWTVRELLRENKMELPRDSLLEGDLCAPKYGGDNYQRILIEEKKDITARIKRSPDSGDSLAITYAFPVMEISANAAEEQKKLEESEEEGGYWNGSRWVIHEQKGSSRWRR